LVTAPRAHEFESEAYRATGLFPGPNFPGPDHHERDRERIFAFTIELSSGRAIGNLAEFYRSSAGGRARPRLSADRRISVGSTLAAFEAKIRGQLPIDTFPTSPAAELIGSRSGFQSCGNRLRRWVFGHKIDPDIMSVDYVLGAPFEIRLTSDDQGQWRISYFQSHAM
jgi:hypothetical protein